MENIPTKRKRLKKNPFIKSNGWEDEDDEDDEDDNYWDDEDDNYWEDEDDWEDKDDFPKFNWDSLSTSAHKSLKAFIKAAEKGCVPNKGLQFYYNTVNLIKMKHLSNDYLRDLFFEAQEKGQDNNAAKDHSLYHRYLVEILNFHLT